MIFRPMTEDDLDKVAKLEKSIFSTPWSKDNFLESLGKNYSHFFVAQMDEVVGYCGIHNLEVVLPNYMLFYTEWILKSRTLYR